ncbi:MAG: hypothetical protein HC767_01415, partial [Akkermansiaceae bacterium]|nr:hypothetical protein [Akkermansiaceae bacterium]
TGGAPAFTPEAALAVNGGKYGDIIVQKGAKLESPTNEAKEGGRITLVGPNVRNEGSISTPDGQTILAAGLQVGFRESADPSLRGLNVAVGKVADPVAGDYAGNVSNSGIIGANRGNITLTGREVNQFGVLTSTTSVAFNGRIDLLAEYDKFVSTLGGGITLFDGATGTVNLGRESLIRILPELKSKETTTGTELTLRSQVNITGRTARFGQDSVLLAPNALVNVKLGKLISSTQAGHSH